MKFNNGYNEVLFPEKSPAIDQKIVQIRQIIIFWHFDLFLLLFARWYTPIYSKFFDWICWIINFFIFGIRRTEICSRITGNYPVISLILDEDEIRHFLEDTKLMKFMNHYVTWCKVATNVRLFGLYPVSTSSRRSRSLKWNLFKDIHPGFHSRRHFWP